MILIQQAANLRSTQPEGNRPEGSTVQHLGVLFKGQRDEATARLEAVAIRRGMAKVFILR